MTVLRCDARRLAAGNALPGFYAASSSSWRGMPRSSKRRINVSSIKLFGQEAPAVMPMTAGPCGSQFCAITSRFSCRL